MLTRWYRIAGSWPLLLVVGALGLPGSLSAQPCNNPPVAQDDEVQHFGGPVLIAVLSNDFEPDGETLTVAVLSSTCNGTITEDQGLLLLTPDSGLPQDCTLVYGIFDEQGESASATVTVMSEGLFADDFSTGSVAAWSSCQSCP
jgi:Bacterial Ig domain